MSSCCWFSAATLLLHLLAHALGATQGGQQQAHATGQLQGALNAPAGAGFDRRVGQLSSGAVQQHQGAQCPYLRHPKDAEMSRYRHAVEAFNAGPGHQQWVAHIKAQPHARGILITAGGLKLVANAIVLLKVLREHLHVHLPVQLAYRDAREMDDVTLAAISDRFGPLMGLDLSQQPQPAHHKRVTDMGGWVAKVYALMHCSFKEVLVLDADTTPLSNVGDLFANPMYRETGSLFWPDAWSNWVKPSAYELLGLDPVTSKAALHAAKGPGDVRDTESGIFLLDRAAHADVLQYLWWASTFAPELYRHVHGDKDTFSLAFALACKAHAFRQVRTPPAAMLRWCGDWACLEVKSSQPGQPANTSNGWQLVGWLQADPSDPNTPILMHRTMNKWELGNAPWPVELVTGPVDTRWAAYYLAHDSKGPTKGVWWEHAVPAHALTPVFLQYQQQLKHMASCQGLQAPPCPALRFLEYQKARTEGLPVGRDTRLEAACAHSSNSLGLTAATGHVNVTGDGPVGGADGDAHLRALMQRTHRPALDQQLPFESPDDGSRGSGSLDHGELGLFKSAMLPAPEDAPVSALYVGIGLNLTQPSAQPLNALTHVARQQALGGSGALRAMHATYDAYAWLVRNRQLFPLLSS